MIDLLQYIGSAILVLHKVPQMYRAYKNRKDLKDLSLSKFGFGILGGVVMLIWALLTGNYGIVGLNAICISYEAFIFVLILKCNYRRRKKEVLE